MKITVLYLVLYGGRQCDISRYKKQMLRICIAAMLGTLIEIVALFSMLPYTVVVLAIQMLEVPAMLIGIMGKDVKKILPYCLRGYLYTLIVNGILETMWYQFGERGGFIFILILSCFVAVLGFRIWRNYSRMKKGIFEVELVHKGTIVRTHGFYDSGNRLKDLHEKKGVHIVCEQIIHKLEKRGIKTERKVYIPYQALGNESGLLEVYYIDTLIVHTEHDSVKIEKCPVGVTKDNLFEGKIYQIILNEEVF